MGFSFRLLQTWKSGLFALQRIPDLVLESLMTFVVYLLLIMGLLLLYRHHLNVWSFLDWEVHVNCRVYKSLFLACAVTYVEAMEVISKASCEISLSEAFVALCPSVLIFLQKFIILVLFLRPLSYVSTNPVLDVGEWTHSVLRKIYRIRMRRISLFLFVRVFGV